MNIFYLRWYRTLEGKAVRLVFDEAHKIFTDKDYRGSFIKVKEFAGFPIQKIFLSASLPPSLEPLFLEYTCTPSSTLFIRAPTTRLNLRYHVLQVENQVKHINKVAIALAKHLQTTTFTEASRGIIFCTD